MGEWEALLAYCDTEKQRRICTMRANGMSAREVSEVEGIAERNVMSICQRLRKRAAKQGYSPEHDMVHTVRS